MKAAKSTSAPLIFTTYDIGRMTGTDPTTVHKWIDRGLLRGYRTPGGHRRVRAEELRAFLGAHNMPIPKELGGAQTLCVMVVDSDRDALRATVRGLKKLKPDWEIVAAESGVDALLRFAAGLPNVLVYDFGISDTDGLALFRQLQSRVDTAGMKLLAVARKPLDIEKRATAAGASACLAKPLVAQALASAVELAAGIEPVQTQA